jgi:hypothetical protein
MNKKYFLLFFVILCLIIIPVFSEDSWEGSASRIRRGELDKEGLYAASNSFPVNTVINVTNIKNGKSVNVTVIQRIGDNQNLFLLLADEAADQLSIEKNESENVRITIVNKYGSDIPSNHDEAYNPDPDKNPQADLAMLDPDYSSESTDNTTVPVDVTEPDTITEPDNITEPDTVTEPDNITEPDTVTEPDNITDPDAVIVQETDITEILESRNPQKDLYREPVDAETFFELEDVEPYDTVALDKEPEKEPDVTEPDVTEPEVTYTDETPEIYNGNDLTPEQDTSIAYLAEPEYSGEIVEDTQEISMAVTRPEQEYDTVETREPAPPDQVSEDSTGPEVFTTADKPDESTLVVDEQEPSYPLENANGHIDAPEGTEEAPVTDVAMLPPGDPDDKKDNDNYVLVPTEVKPPDTEPDKEPEQAIIPDQPVVTDLNIDSVTGRIFYIQIAAFSDYSAAQTLKGKYSGEYPVEIQSSTGSLHKVVIGPLNKDESGTVLYRFRSMGFDDAFLRQN